MRARAKRYEEDSIPAWQTIYCSLILIMLVLFVMLVSYSVPDARKVSGLMDTFSVYHDGQGAKGSTNGAAGHVPRGGKNDLGWITEAIRTLSANESLNELRGDVVFEKTGKGLKSKIKSDVLFGPGEATIKSISYPYLDEMIRIAKKHDLFMRIEGHTDDTPIHNDTFLSNWELSTARSVSVLKYCLKKGEIPAERLRAAGFSQYRPLAPNDTPQGRAQNRRIEVIIEAGNS